jgi:hypothetical protein
MRGGDTGSDQARRRTAYREGVILDRRAQGVPFAEIAAELGVSVRMVERGYKRALMRPNAPMARQRKLEALREIEIAKRELWRLIASAREPAEKIAGFATLFKYLREYCSLMGFRPPATWFVPVPLDVSDEPELEQQKLALMPVEKLRLIMSLIKEKEDRWKCHQARRPFEEVSDAHEPTAPIGGQPEVDQTFDEPRRVEPEVEFKIPAAPEPTAAERERMEYLERACSGDPACALFDPVSLPFLEAELNALCVRFGLAPKPQRKTRLIRS